MKQSFFVQLTLVFLFACRTSHSAANAKATKALVGKYKMEMVLSEEELRQNPHAKQILDMMKLECELTNTGKCFMMAEMMGQSKRDTAYWRVNQDSLILMSNGRRDAVLMTKGAGGNFLISQKSGGPAGDVITIKYTKLK